MMFIINNSNFIFSVAFETVYSPLSSFQNLIFPGIQRIDEILAYPLQLSQHHLLKRLLLPIELSWHPYWKLINNKCRGLFLDSQSIPLKSYASCFLNCFDDGSKIYNSIWCGAQCIATHKTIIFKKWRR